MAKINAGACLAVLIWLCAGSAQASTGAWERAWGKDVGGTGLNLCIVASTCQAGTSSTNPGEFDTTQGIAADSSGNIYVVDTDNDRVEKFDSSGNFLLAWGSQGSAAGQFIQPTDVAVGTGGVVYVSDSGNARIQEFDSSGNFILTWGNGVAGGSGYEVCTDPATPCQSGATGSAEGEFNSPGGIGTDSTGNVYVADGAATGNNRIQVFDPNGAFMLTWGKGVNGGAGAESCTGSCSGGLAGALGGELNNPSDVAVDGAGRVYVVDQNNLRIEQFDESGAFVRTWGKDVGGSGVDMCTPPATCQTGTFGTKGGQFQTPKFVAADSSDGVYVSDLDNQRIQRFNSSGTFKRAWGKDVEPTRPGLFGICTVASACLQGTTGALGGEMNAPYGVATGPGGVVFVADFGNARVQKFVLAPPVVGYVTPGSPANNNTPSVHGTVEPGTTVGVFSNPTCSGVPFAIGGDIEFSSTGLSSHMPDDSTYTFYGATTDELGQVSACSASSVTYVEDSTAPNTVLDSAPSGVTSNATPTITFHSTEAGATFVCRFDFQAFGPCSGPGASDTPQLPLADGPHTFDVTSTDLAGNVDVSPAGTSFTVDTSPAPLPPPVRGKLVNAIPEKGTVLVKVAAGTAKARAAASRFVPLETLGAQVPVGSTLDTTRGTVRLTAATTATGTKTQVGHFNGGLFVLGQGKKNPLTTVSMTGGGLKSCGRVPRGGSPKVRGARKRRTLFSNVHGHFRSRGRNSTATVAGTAFRMTDTCTGTLTVVQRGRVRVFDLRKHRTVTITQGHRYFASSLRKH